MFLFSGGGWEPLGDAADPELLQLPELLEAEHHRGGGLGQGEDLGERGRAQHHPQPPQHDQAPADPEHSGITLLMWLMTGCDWSWKINIRCYLCCEYPATNKSEERFRISSNISEIIENSSESPDLVLSSTLNTYTTDLINFQSAQIEIPSEKEERMELMILYSVLILL